MNYEENLLELIVSMFILVSLFEVTWNKKDGLSVNFRIGRPPAK